MKVFSEKTLKALHDAGWTEARFFDPSSYIARLRQKQYPVHTAVTDFLKRFGGIVVMIPHPVEPKLDFTHQVA